MATKELIYFNKTKKSYEFASALTFLKQKNGVKMHCAKKKDLIRITKEFKRENYFLLFVRDLTQQEISEFKNNPVDFYRRNMYLFRESVYF